jgi:hypothetical protein
MQALTKRQTASHWYLADGSPFYEVPSKSKPGQMRKATLADARIVGALPSVGGIKGVIDKPGLRGWFADTIIHSALTLPRNAGEVDDDFAVRIAADADTVRENAMETGIALHDLAQQYLQNEKIGQADDRILALFAPLKKWIDENVEQSILVEKSMGSRVLGYGGRMDAILRLRGQDLLLVSDFKSQGVKPGKKATFYEDDWPLQLVAYRELAKLQHDVEGQELGLMSVVVNTTSPTPIETKIWSEPEKYLEAFNHAFGLWRYINNFDPRSNA